MTDSAGTMPFDALHAFLEKIDIAVRDLRSALEANDMDRLPAALELTNEALESINAYPGGAEKLRGDINQFPEGQKEQLLNLLNETSTNHQINGDLIRLAQSARPFAVVDLKPYRRLPGGFSKHRRAGRLNRPQSPEYPHFPAFVQKGGSD